MRAPPYFYDFAGNASLGNDFQTNSSQNCKQMDHVLAKRVFAHINMILITSIYDEINMKIEHLLKKYFTYRYHQILARI